MPTHNLQIDELLVQRLIATQFPQWKDFPVKAVAAGGWDNRTFHLGETMLVRMPSGPDYAAQVEKEQYWLPKLAPQLPLQIPVPVAMGEPGENYPWKWSIYKWLPGESASTAHITDLCDFAQTLAEFLIALHRIDPTGGPVPGQHSFFRGGSLLNYDAETHQAIAVLKDKIDSKAAHEVWQAGLATNWQHASVWVHGDLSAGNLLVQDGDLSAVIDFGILTIGDPACDLAIAWTLFDTESREIFQALLPLDAGTWARGRAWTLWKALIVATELINKKSADVEHQFRIIETVITNHQSKT